MGATSLSSTGSNPAILFYYNLILICLYCAEISILNTYSTHTMYGNVAKRLAWEPAMHGLAGSNPALPLFYHNDILISAHCADKRYMNYI